MYSVRDSMVRETTSPLVSGNPTDQRNAAHHANATTLTENSSLFLIHQLRQQESTRPLQRRRWWCFWRKD